MRHITPKEVQVIEQYDDSTSVDQMTVHDVKFRDMRSHGFKRVKDKKTGEWFWKVHIDCRTV